MRTKLFIGLAVILLVISIVSASMLLPVNEKAKENGKAPDNSLVIDETEAGEWDLKVNGLERIEFIHYKKGFVKPEGAGAKIPSCYKFLSATKPRWKTLPVNYVINPSNPQNLDEGFVTSAISTSAETWDAATSKELMNDVYVVDYSASYGIQNYKNTLAFGNYPTEGVIAVTSIWWNPATKAIVEFDILFDTDFTWGDATIDATKMDLQNIAVHELGHGVGLGDIYDTVCSDVTMYGYSTEGETKKRSLEQADIKGLQTLYGI